MSRSVTLALLLLALTAVNARGAAPADFFEKRIRPLLIEHCQKCHGADKAKGGLRLDTAAGLAKGGASGAAVKPGDPEHSLLIQAVRRGGEIQMPPDKPMRDADIAALVDWVKSGAVWPGATPLPVATAPETAPTTKLWSFQKVAPVKPPAVKRRDWARTPIDAFVLAALEGRGLTPAAPADKRTLIRRATFDLIGLPPTPEETEAFVADRSPDAFAKVVDRLLRSPHYGERWGRHWLDAVRFAETTANDANAVMRYAYRYRDYVVNSFNRDKPYDQFIIEQLAGDLLPPTKDLNVAIERVVATGFLMVGPKALAETDKEQSRLDIVDDQVDVTGRAFLGLTLGCARCHDHKFDPIRTTDYYALAGIFRSTEVFRDEVRNSTMWQEWPLFELPGEKPFVVMAPKEGQTRDLRVHVRGSRFQLGAVVPRRFPLVLTGDPPPALPKNQSGRLELARWIADPSNPLTARVMVNRIWQGHFGQGLVRSSDNFGARGDTPSHPELLDWLATRFIDSGWSIKAMHREIMLSQTYQQASADLEARSAEQKAEGLKAPRFEFRDPRSEDSDNRLLWRMNRRRLEAEALRDAMLAVSGKLDRSIGGNACIEVVVQAAEVIDAKRGFLVNRVNSHHAVYQTPRRSIYLPVIRNALPDSLALFDAADPNSVAAVRNETTVPAQALFMLNNPFVREQSLHFARALLADAKASDADRIRRAHQSALGRPPSEREQTDAAAWIKKYTDAAKTAGRNEPDARLSAWQSYCQTLFCANEFIYLD